MKKFRVIVPEIHYSHYIIEAETAEQAIERFEDCEGGEVVYTEFSHEMTSDSIDPYQVTEEDSDGN